MFPARWLTTCLVVFASSIGLAKDSGSPNVLSLMSDVGSADKLMTRAAVWVGPFKGHKHESYEGGLLVPACAVRPGKIRPGSTASVRCSTVDYFPTIAKIVGFEFGSRDKRPIDGTDLMPVVRGDIKRRSGELFFAYRRLHSGIDGQAILLGDWKLLREAKPEGRVRLHDLANDPFEQRDLADEKPERVQQLMNRRRRIGSNCQLRRDGADYRYWV